MKKFRKKIVVLALVILIGIVVSKVYCFVIVNRVYREINEFREAENRYYEVTTLKNGQLKCREEIFRKGSKIKYLMLNGGASKLYFEFRDFDTNEGYFWIDKIDSDKFLRKHQLYITDKEFMPSTPNLVWKINKNNEFSIKEFLKIYYIISIKYKGKICYKIVTKSEIIIIDKNTYLPIYVCENWVNSKGEDVCKMEYFYELKINFVIDEDMKKLMG